MKHSVLLYTAVLAIVPWFCVARSLAPSADRVASWPVAISMGVPALAPETSGGHFAGVTATPASAAPVAANTPSAPFKPWAHPLGRGKK